MLFIVFWPVCEVWKRDLSFNSFQSVSIMWVCWVVTFLCSIHCEEGDIGGYPKKLANTEIYTMSKLTKNWYHIYDQSCLLKFHSSRIFVYLKYVCTCNQPQPLRENMRRHVYITTTEKPCLWMPHQFHHYRITVRNCLIIYQ